jgi:hypothetical protein
MRGGFGVGIDVDVAVPALVDWGYLESFGNRWPVVITARCDCLRAKTSKNGDRVKPIVL